MSLQDTREIATAKIVMVGGGGGVPAGGKTGYYEITSSQDGDLGTMSYDDDYMIVVFKTSANHGSGLRYYVLLSDASTGTSYYANLEDIRGNFFREPLRIGTSLILKKEAGGDGTVGDPKILTVVAVDNNCVTIGRRTNTSEGNYSTAEGNDNTASGNYSHAEGESTTASASAAHAEGDTTVAAGVASHSEGFNSFAGGDYSHASGSYTSVNYNNQTAVGKYNNNKSTTLFEVGNGTGISSSRKNAFEVYNDGKISMDDGATKFKFTNNGSSDGYYDASGTFHPFGAGGTSMSKTRYTITASSWSNNQDTSGYYNYRITLNPTLSTSYPPNVYIAGVNDNTFSTDTEKTQFALLDECDLTASNTLVLFAKEKPTSTFYIFVEGQVS